MPFVRNYPVRTCCWWMIRSCVAPPQKKLFRWCVMQALKKCILLRLRRECDIPTSDELIAHGKTIEEISTLIGADWLVYQDLDQACAAINAAALSNNS